MFTAVHRNCPSLAHSFQNRQHWYPWCQQIICHFEIGKYYCTHYMSCRPAMSCRPFILITNTVARTIIFAKKRTVLFRYLTLQNRNDSMLAVSMCSIYQQCSEECCSHAISLTSHELRSSLASWCRHRHRCAVCQRNNNSIRTHIPNVGYTMKIQEFRYYKVVVLNRKKRFTVLSRTSIYEVPTVHQRNNTCNGCPCCTPPILALTEQVQKVLLDLEGARLLAYSPMSLR